MGRHSAGSSYLRAIAQEKYSELGVLIRNKNDQDSFMNLFKSFLKNDQKIDLTLIPSNLPELSNNFGGIFLGDPQLGNYSILRSNFGHHLYSLVAVSYTHLTLPTKRIV